MIMLSNLVKLVWLTVLFLLGFVVMIMLLICGFTAIVQMAEDIRTDRGGRG